MNSHHFGILILVSGVITGIVSGVIPIRERNVRLSTQFLKSHGTNVTPLSSNFDRTSRMQKSETQEKLEILDDVFQSRNDNDPRLDQDFNQLSLETKEALKQKYDSLVPEARNQKGTIIFLLGRNLSSSHDLEFLRHVLRESPCLSLDHCSTPDVDQTAETSDSLKMTLEYPQIVAIKALQSYLDQTPDSSTAIEILKEATRADGPLATCLLARQMASAYIRQH